MKKSMKHKKYPKFEDYDFSDCREITGDELYRINGGAQVENSSEAIAGAQIGDTIVRDDGTEITLTQGDIDWAKDHLGGGNDSTSATPDPVNTNPSADPTNPAGSTSASSDSSSSSSGNTSDATSIALNNNPSIPDNSNPGASGTGYEPPKEIMDNPQAYGYWKAMQDLAAHQSEPDKYKDYNVLGYQNKKVSSEKNKLIANSSLYGAPTDSRRVTSPKGVRTDASPSDHTGIDIGASVPGVKGDNIYSVERGTVIRNGKTGSGCSRLEISLPNGDTAVYIHGDFPGLSAGDTVDRGQVIGTMSDVGSPGQIHLHFEIRTNGIYTDSAAAAPDPLDYLPSDYYIVR